MKYFLNCFLLLFTIQTLSSQCPGTSLCSICQADLTVTEFSGGTILNGTSTIPGTVLAGGSATGDTIVVEVNGCGEIDIAVELDFVWEQGNGINWIHGVSFQASGGWSAAEVVLPNPDWIFQDTIVGACFDQSFGAGYYYDPVGANCGGGDNSSWNGTNCGGTFCEEDDPWLTDGEAFDNWGDDCEFNCPEFGFELSFCPQIAEPVTETIGFFITDDAQSGGWDTDDGCVFDINFVIKFVPAELSEVINSCQGECVTLNAGAGCDSYLWNTGETTPSIVVCPIVETDYIIMANSTNGCVITDTITVIPEFCCNAFAGELTGGNVCPGDDLTVTVSNFQDSIGYDEYLLVTDASGIIIDIINGASVTLTSEICTTFTIYAYNHYTLDASPVPVIGDDVNLYDCTNNCCDLEPLTVEFEDTVAPEFVNPPMSEEIDCLDNLDPPQDLDWTDNCGLMGTAPISSETNNATLCAGGTIERTWMTTDSCGNQTTATQTITVLPLAPPMFLNPPADEVQSCGFNPMVSDLNWENGLTGACEESGVESGVLSGSHDNCGGSYSILWEYTDVCGQVASHTQNITIDPAPEASFLNVPADITYQCETIPATFPDLDYTNGETGSCEISGTEQVTTSGTYDICGGVLLNTWEYTDDCGRVISENQQVTIDPAPEAMFINLPTDITLACDAASTAGVDLFYENGLVGTCEISGFVQPTTTGTYDICGGSIVHEWEYVDLCGRPINYSQTITIDPAPEALFINPPGDITVACGSAPSASSLLSYSNGLTGDCEISGDVMGVLSAFDPCTNTMTEEWNFVDECGNPLNHSRIITVSDIGPIVFDNIPATITLECDEVNVNLVNLDFSNNSQGVCLIEGNVPPVQSGSYNACGGNLTLTWETTDVCGTVYTATQTIIVNPALEASFTNVPSNQTLSCDNLSNPPNLNVTNGLSGACLISDSVSPTIQDNFDECGGEIIYTWEYTDACGRTISASQTITVSEAPAPTWTNPPQDVTVSCDDVGAFVNFLNYSNNEAPPCLISGNGIAIETGSYDVCGGQLTQTWSEVDQCGNPLTYVRTITIDAAPPAFFLDPPPDITLNCGEAYSSPNDLIYTNNSTDVCEIQGSVQAVVSQNGNVYTHTWSFQNPCGAVLLEHSQTVTISPDLDLTVNPTIIDLCLGESFDLGSISVVDNNGQAFDLEYYEGFPSSAGTQIFDLNISPTISSIYTIRVFNDLGCADEIAITINVDMPPFAGEDNLVELCVPGVINLLELLGPSSTAGGTWEDLDGANVNLDNPFAIVIGSQQPGLYQFSYTVASGNTCPSDEAIISVNYFELTPIEIDTIYCTNNNTTYTVELQSFGAIILASEGNVVDQGNGNVIITDIPIDVSVGINNLDPLNQCVGFININPPNCNCPSVEPPTGINAIACESDDMAVLYGEYEDGLILHWYENESDDTPILSGVDSLVISDLQEGIYSYYINTESIDFPGCFSPFLTEVTLEVIASPPATVPQDIAFCVNDVDLPLILDLSFYNTQINSNLDNVIEYFETLEETYSQNNGFADIALNATDSIYASITNLFGCVSYIGFEIVINTNPSIELTLTNPLCQDDSGSVLIDEPSNIEDYIIVLEGDTVSYPDNFEDLAVGEYELILTHTTTFCSDTTTFEIEEGLALNIESINYVCDNNDTGTNSEDDFYTITYEISSSSDLNTNYEVFFDGESQGEYAYNETHSVTWPANGIEILIEFIDIETQCFVETLSIPLNPCSTNCEITPDQLEFVCNDNDTDSDPSDDFISVTISASSINGSSDNTYIVLINNIASYVFEYGIVSSFELPADGSTPSIVIVDSEDNQCQLILDVDPLNPCSFNCSLSITDFELECFNNGTEDDFEDDFYVINIDIVIANGNPSGDVNVIIDDGAEMIYSIDDIELTLAADEVTHTIIIQDIDSLMCSDTIEIGPLLNCSSPCSVNVDIFDFMCDDNNTSMDATDDFITVNWQVSAIDGSANNLYQVYLDNILLGVYTYGDNITETINVLNGNEVTIEFIDTEFENCFNSELIQLNSCSDECSIDAVLELVECFNNSTNNTETDDSFYVTISVQGINTSSNWFVEGEVESYNYNESIQLGPFDIINGDIQLVLIDSTNDTCPDTLDVQAPSPCSMCNQTVEAGDSIEINCADNEANLIGISSSLGEYSWSGPQGFISNDSVIISSVPGWHYFEAIFDDGCSVIDSMLVFSLEEIPVAIAGPDSMLTCLVELIELEGQYDTNGDFSVYWENEDGNIISNTSTVEISTSGFYYFYVLNNANGCLSVPDEVFISLNVETPDAFIFADPDNTLDCKVELVTLSYNNQLNVVYEWSYENETSIAAIFEIDTAGTVILTATDTITGCVSIDSVFIQELEEFPIINLAPIQTLNCDIIEVTLDASASIPFTTSVFEWSSIDGNIISNDPSVTVVDTGFYIVVVTDTVSGCENADTLHVISEATLPIISVSDDLIFNCDDVEAILEANSDNQGEYTWNTINGNIVSTNNNEITVNSPGIYIVTFIDDVSFCEVIDTIEIIEDINEINLNNWESEDETCFGENDGMLLVGEIQGGVEPYELVLNNASIEQEDLFNLPPGTYDLVITDSDGCLKDTTFIVSPALDITISNPQAIVLELGEDGVINVTTSIPETSIDTVIWSPDVNLECNNCLSNITYTLDDIDYTVTIIDENGCEISTTIEIRIIDEISIYTPNVITSNNDGLNDKFTLFSNEELLISELAIYNRWGERVFFTENIPTNVVELGWDGTFKGEPVNPGVFAFYAIVLLPEGGEETVVGDVTVLK